MRSPRCAAASCAPLALWVGRAAAVPDLDVTVDVTTVSDDVWRGAWRGAWGALDHAASEGAIAFSTRLEVGASGAIAYGARRGPWAPTLGLGIGLGR